LIKLFGIPIRFHPLFVLMALFSLLTGFFIELVTLFGIVLIHELGHIAAAKGVGWNVRHIQLLPFGGVAEVEDSGGVTALDEIIVAAAGPLQNFIMIGVTLLIQQLGWWSNEWGAFFIYANLSIACFNMLPINPLDGGRIFQSLMSMWFTYHRTLVICTFFSLIMSVLMVILSVGRIFFSGIQLNLLIIGLFLCFSNWQIYRNIPFYFVRFLMNRQLENMRIIRKGRLAKPIIVDKRRSVAHILKLFVRGQYHLIYIMNDKGKLEAVVPEQRLTQAYFNKM
jgi:stage IV sporulation protein FB